MRINLFKLLILGFLALSSLPLAYAQSQFATVIVNNTLDTPYCIVDYTQSGNGFFSTQPNTVPPHEQVAFTGDFYSSGSTAGFTLKQDSNNPNCTPDPQQQLGHYYEAHFTYSNGPIPKVKISDNAGPCLGSCSFAYDSVNNPNDITVTITTSNK